MVRLSDLWREATGQAGAEVVVVRQVHGTTVLDVPSLLHLEESRDSLVEADALVGTGGHVLSVRTADCGSIALAGASAFAVVHAGWRGLLDGVIERAVAVLRAMGGTDLIGALGPCIHAECYEFSASDLVRLVDRFGARVAVETSSGRPAFDLVAAVDVALEEAGVTVGQGVDRCTACYGTGTLLDDEDGGPPSGLPRYYSHRARGELGRQVLLVGSMA